ncbi:hypothetical protein WA158_006742 [Blastocystis sp. Blastoise]
MSKKFKFGDSSLINNKVSDDIRQLIIKEDQREQVRQKNLEAKKKKWEDKMALKQKKKLEREENMPKYRDRAQEIKTLGYDMDSIGIKPENYDELTVEETKQLGGDLLHTHLVKGLDTILLRKRREELEKEIEEQKQKEASEHVLSVKSDIAKHIYTFLTNKNDHRNKIRQFFAPHRYTYSISFTTPEEEEEEDQYTDWDELNQDGYLHSIPPLIAHSKYDCPDPSSYMRHSLTEEQMNQLSQTLKLVGQSSLKKSKKRKEQTKEVPKVIKPVDEDNDIFSEDEEYTYKGKDNHVEKEENKEEIKTTGPSLPKVLYNDINEESISNDSIKPSTSNISDIKKNPINTHIEGEDMEIDTINNDDDDDDVIDFSKANPILLNKLLSQSRKISEAQDKALEAKNTKKRFLFEDDGYQLDFMEDDNNEDRDQEGVSSKRKMVSKDDDNDNDNDD